MSKIFERVIFDQLTSNFNLNKMFYRSQYGFREKHSKEFAALERVDTITQELDKGNTPLGIYFSQYFCTNYNITVLNIAHWIYLKVNGFGIKSTI